METIVSGKKFSWVSFFWILLPPVIVTIGIISVWKYWGYQQVKTLIQSKLNSYNESQDKFKIQFEEFELSLLKLQLKVKHLDLKFGPGLNDLPPVSVADVKLQVDPFNLVIGQLSASYIQLDGIEYEIDEKNYHKLFSAKSNKPTTLDLAPLFELLPQIPIQNVYLTHSYFKLQLPPQSETSLSKINIYLPQTKIKNLVKRITLESLHNEVTLISNRSIKTSAYLNISGQFDEKKIYYSRIDISTQRSHIKTRLNSSDIKNLLIEPKAQIAVQSKIQLDDIKDFYYVTNGSTERFSRLIGTLNVDSEVMSENFKKNKGWLKIDYHDVALDNFKFGSGEIETQVVNNNLKFDTITIEHPAGVAYLKNVALENEKPYRIKTDVILENFDLQKMFQSLGLTNIPAYLQANGKATCEGQILDLDINCKSQLKAQNIKVDADLQGHQNIVKVKQLSSIGDVQIKQQGIIFKSDQTLVKSGFKAEGGVSFEEGFKIKTSSQNLDLDEIENLANLGLKGILSGDLDTYGTSSYGVIEANLKAENTVIDQFYLGQTDTNLVYQSGEIRLNPLNGKINQTDYSGTLTVNLPQSRVTGEFDLPQANITDLLSTIEEKWHLPIVASGKGKAHIKFDGPLNFWKLNLDLSAQFKNGMIYGENYTQFNSHITSDGEHLTFNDVKVHKPNGFLKISQTIDIDKQNQPLFNLKLNSANLHLEDIDHITEYFTTATGQVRIQGNVTGPLDKARLRALVQLEETRLSGQLMPPSTFETELNKNYFTAQGQLFSRQLQTNLKIPFSSTENYDIQLQANEFQPLVLLPLIGLPPNSYDIQSTMKADMHLVSKGHNLSSLNGKINIDQFEISRNDLNLKLENKATINYNGGIQNMNPLVLAGPDQKVQLKLNKVSGQSRIETSGRLYLKPLQFLVPFTDSLNGVLEFNVDVGSKDNRLDMQGEGLIHNMSLSTKGFPYPLKDISAYFDFNKTKIIFSEISGLLNQAEFSGQGTVDILGAQNIKVNVEAETDEVDLEFPAKFKTTGVAQILFSGNWLPYTLKIDYQIREGLITKEFTEQTEDAPFVVTPNFMLPEVYLSKDRGALVLDATASFERGVAIKNSLLEGIASGLVTARGPLNAFVLGGKVDLQPGSRLIFKDKPFEIQKGYVQFNETKDINPYIFITATAKVSEYDINLDVQGFAKGPPKINATSQPYLAENDIFSLLALGYVSSGQDQNLSSETQQAQTGLEVLSAIGNQSEFSKKIQSRLGLNVQLSPSVDSTKNIAVPKVVVTKKLSKKVQTSYSRTLSGDQQNNEVKMQWLFRPDTSLILNYQNQPQLLDNNIIYYQDQNDVGVGGVGLEYKKEFK